MFRYVLRSPFLLPLKKVISSMPPNIIKQPCLLHAISSGPTVFDKLNVGHFQVRPYATKKAKKEKGKKGKPHAHVNVELTDEEKKSVIKYDKMVHEMESAIEHLNQEYITQLSVRTNTGVFDNLQVNTPDGKFPLNQLCQIIQKSPTLLAINLGATPQYLPAVKTALTDSGMNINPQQDGNMLFVPLPTITKEHRENLAKNAKTLCDKAKDRLRHVHNDYTRAAKKQTGVSEDLVRNVINIIQSMMHDYHLKADELLHAKQKELLGKK